MQLSLRWHGRRSTFVPPSVVVDPMRYDVALISEDEARAFVIGHHYSASYPAARLRIGLCRGSLLVGVAVFSIPCSQAVLPKWTGLPSDQAVELGRFVLLDEVPFNAESWFIARCFPHVRSELGVRAVLSFSDPMPRTNTHGHTIFPGHVGTIYQASNAAYLGQANRNTVILDGHGKVIHNRALSKLRTMDKGARRTVERLMDMGCPPPRVGEGPHEYLARALSSFRRVRHPGNHAYVFGMDKHIKRQLAKRKRARPRFSLAQ